MKIIFTLALMAFAGAALSQQSYLDQSKQKHLIGQFPVSVLKSDTSYNKWFDKNYMAYQSDENIVNQLKPLLTHKLKVQIFLGTWCGDSKREVPRLIKLFDKIGFTNYDIIGTYNTDSLYKVSPQHEEAGLNIFRVPTFVIYKDGKELNRIIEYPKESFETDLVSILKNKEYSPNYSTGHSIDTYFLEKNYNDSIIEKTAKLLKGKTFGFSELNSKAYVELRKGNKAYAIALFKVNSRLYPGLDAYDSLAEAYTANKDKTKAIAMWQYIAEDANAKNKKALEQLRKLTIQ